MQGDVSDAWRSFRAQTDLDEYETRWDRLAAQGHDVHGEADLVTSYAPVSVLDAGCGMGRVAIELARRGIEVVGVDLDADLLVRAHRRAPEIRWVEANLARLDHLGRTFDLVVMAGNVLPFADPADRPTAVAACAAHLRPGGRLVVGSTLAPGWPTVHDHDEWCAAADLELSERFSGWAREPWDPGAGHAYAVSVHVRRLSPASPPR